MDTPPKSPEPPKPVTNEPSPPEKPQPAMPEWLRVSMASIGGYLSAFIILFAAATVQSGQQNAQLVSGNTVATGSTPNSPDVFIQSYVFWAAVIVFGFVFTLVLLKIIRRKK